MVRMIETTAQLTEFCKHLKKSACVAVDTEFLREKTYYPTLCLIQVASKEQAACIDVLSGLDLTPFWDVLMDKSVLKVVHSCRQDIEIFYDLIGKVPSPLFDTQVGAMVCGLGENVSYHNLVQHFLHIDIDKASQVTDWSKRPLTPKQQEYALYDVVYLIKVYPLMQELLASSKRTSWLKEEMQALENPKLYYTDSNDAWLRVKPLSNKPVYLSALKALCAWREDKAKERNRPRRYILKDETLLQLAAIMPTNPEDFNKLRDGASIKNSWQNEIVEIIKHAQESDDVPVWSRPVGLPLDARGISEILKLLLTVCCAEAKVAPKMVATNEDLNKLVLDSNADIPALKGWRREIFGQKALDFKAGKTGLYFNPKTHRPEWIELKNPRN